MHDCFLIIIDRSLTVYVNNLKRVYQTPPEVVGLPLPNCKHIKLAMTNEKGTRHTREPDELIEHRVKGEIEPLMASKVPVDMDNIFDNETFDNVHRPLVILVEGAFGSGKTMLAYHYCQKWTQGNLAMFDLVALVYLRHPAVHSAGKKNLTLDQLLLLASNGGEDIDEIHVARLVAQLVKDDLKCLLILDGWDEAPACIRAPPDPKYPPNDSFLGSLLHCVSPNTTILITSRPDSSVDLHNRSNVKRVEILGFTKQSIHEYFHEALSTRLHSGKLEEECRKLKDHLANYPAIESSCYIPLNAAILTLLYLEHNRTLPTTHFEMFHELLLYSIFHEVNTRQPERNLGTISSLDALPRDLKKQLKLISSLAFVGVMNNKVVFIEDELLFVLPRGIWDKLLSCWSGSDSQQGIPGTGVLQKVELAGMYSNFSYNFVHLSIQEMLAAYHISQLGYFERMRVFRRLLSSPRFTSVLPFYAGFTKLTHRGVRNILTDLDMKTCSKLSLLCLIRCFFEAQIYNESMYRKIISRIDKKLSLEYLTLSSLDCMSVGYFLAFLFKYYSGKLSVHLSTCNIDDHSIGLMMGELSKQVCPESALELDIHNNKIGDVGIAKVLQSPVSTFIKALNVRGCGISDEGAESLAGVLGVNWSLQELFISGNQIGSCGLDHIVKALQRNTTLKKLWAGGGSLTRDNEIVLLSEALTANCSLEYLRLYWSSARPDNVFRMIGQNARNSQLKTLFLHVAIHTSKGEVLTKERAKEWLEYLEVGGKELVQSLEDSRVDSFHLLLHHNTENCLQSYLSINPCRQAIEATVLSINSTRTQKGLPDIQLDIFSS